METAVRKATRLDYNPPKEKHLQTLISLTFQNPGNAALIIDLLERRLRENSWIIIFKVLIIIHTLMRQGEGEKAIQYVETRPSALDTTKLREKSSGKLIYIYNIYLYTAYLEQKVIAYRHLRVDYVKSTMHSKESKLRHLSVSDGLLKDTIILQKQIGTLLKCHFILDDVDNNISLYAFRLLIEDLLTLFQVINEAIVNILEHYFAMDRTNARYSLEIYKRFARQTEETISFLERARSLQHELNISIPTVKHAPLSLAAALQEYLDDANKAEEQKRQKEETPSATVPSQVTNNNNPTQQPKELIDFFNSLENEKVNIFYNPVVQTQAIQPAFTPINTQPTGQHNPFRANTTSIPSQSMIIPSQSMMISSQSASLLPQHNEQKMNANPFRASTMPISLSSPIYSPTSFNNNNNVYHSPIAPQHTSNNPFNSNINNNHSTEMGTNNPFNISQKQQAVQPWGNTLY
ncbi:ANTH domain-containing protein [Pilobolus umbonatus]|nr:ANTH domain-containing protein [Pilobolus umbonatus]